jgi:hypothetical protein
MKKALVISLAKGVSGMYFVHGISCLVFQDKFLPRDLVVYGVIGLIIGFIIYRTNKKYKGYKL